MRTDLILNALQELTPERIDAMPMRVRDALQDRCQRVAMLCDPIMRR